MISGTQFNVALTCTLPIFYDKVIDRIFFYFQLKILSLSLSPGPCIKNDLAVNRKLIAIISIQLKRYWHTITCFKTCGIASRKIIRQEVFSYDYTFLPKMIKLFFIYR